eukprot:1188159-Prorocentrum_minimum.AAC.4
MTNADARQYIVLEPHEGPPIHQHEQHVEPAAEEIVNEDVLNLKKITYEHSLAVSSPPVEGRLGALQILHQEQTGVGRGAHVRRRRIESGRPHGTQPGLQNFGGAHGDIIRVSREGSAFAGRDRRSFLNVTKCDLRSFLNVSKCDLRSFLNVTKCCALRSFLQAFQQHSSLEADHRTGGRVERPVGGPHAHHVRPRGAVQRDAHCRIVAQTQIGG